MLVPKLITLREFSLTSFKYGTKESNEYFPIIVTIYVILQCVYWMPQTIADYSRINPIFSFKNSEYDQEIPQSQTADDPMTPRGRATPPSRDSRKTN